MHYCKKCNKECEVKFGSGVFCSRACANSRERTEEIKQKISTNVKSCEAYISGRMSHKGKIRVERVDRTCSICNATYKTKISSEKKFCSYSCSLKSPSLGGYRQGSGRSKSGWYKGIYCGSTWELAFLVWALDHDLPVVRCTNKFPYVFEKQLRSYLPDFVINNFFIEIKGYDTHQTNSKIEQFPESLIVLRKEDLQPIFNYAISQYGKNYFELYEGNPYKEKNNFCKECGNPCKKVYCSQRCSAFGNHYRKKR